MPREDLKPIEDSRPFDMVEATLVRLDGILKAIAEVDSDTEFQPYKKQSIKVKMVKHFILNAMALLDDDEEKKYSEISNRLKMKQAKVLWRGKETGQTAEIYDEDLEQQLNDLLFRVQRALVRKGFYNKRGD